MKTTLYQNKDEWLAARKGKITGSRASSVTAKRGGEKKIGFYELIAEKIAVSEEDFDGYIPNETPMQRGTRLEEFALDRFAKETGKDLDTSLVIWELDENPDIAISPDAVVITSDIPNSEAIESKCLASSRHIEAYITQEIPSEYYEQGIQYFVVNPSLEKLSFAFYDPRIVVKDFFVIEMTRSEYEKDIKEQKEHQLQTLKEVEEEVNKLSSF